MQYILPVRPCLCAVQTLWKTDSVSERMRSVRAARCFQVVQPAGRCESAGMWGGEKRFEKSGGKYLTHKGKKR